MIAKMEEQLKQAAAFGIELSKARDDTATRAVELEHELRDMETMMGEHRDNAEKISTVNLELHAEAAELRHRAEEAERRVETFESDNRSLQLRLARGVERLDSSTQPRLRPLLALLKLALRAHRRALVTRAAAARPPV